MGRIISKTCQTLWAVLSEKSFIKAPDSEEEWLTIVAELNDKWNFRHCLGAIDGKHVSNKLLQEVNQISLIIKLF